MVSILLISIGMTFIIYGILLFIEKIKIMKNGLKTDGKVIDFEEDVHSYIDNKKIVYKPIYRPIISFKDQEGNVHIEKLEDYDDICRSGEKISIVYSSKDKDEFEIYVKKNIFKFLSNMISMGIIFIIFGIILTLC